MTEKYVAVLVTLATAFLYYAGWVYLYHYYFYLGIDLFEVNPSVQYTLIYAFPALEHLFVPQGELCVLSVSLVFGAVAFFLLYQLTKNRWAGRHIVSLVCAAVALMMLVEGYRSAKSLAQIRAADKWMNDSNPAYLGFITKAASSNDPPEAKPNQLSNALRSANDQLKLRHILSTPQFHYLFARDDCDTAEYQMCDGFLFRVKVSDATVTILHPGEVKHAR